MKLYCLLIILIIFGLICSKTLTGSILNIEGITQTDTMKSLKEKIRKQEEISKNYDIELRLDGMKLKINETIKNYKINGESNLFLILNEK